MMRLGYLPYLEIIQRAVEWIEAWTALSLPMTTKISICRSLTDGNAVHDRDENTVYLSQGLGFLTSPEPGGQMRVS